MEMELSWKPGIVCMTGKGLTIFELGSDSDFSNNCTMYTTGERSEKKKIKITFGPPSPTNKISTQDPFSDES